MKHDGRPSSLMFSVEAAMQTVFVKKYILVKFYIRRFAAKFSTVAENSAKHFSL